MYHATCLVVAIVLYCPNPTPAKKQPALMRCFPTVWYFFEVTFNVWKKSNFIQIHQDLPWYLWVYGEDFDLWLLFPLSLSLSLSWGCSCDGETARGVDWTHGGHAEDSTGRGMVWTNLWVQNQLISVWAELLSTTAGWQWKEANSTFWEICKFAFCLRGRWKDCLYGVTA